LSLSFRLDGLSLLFGGLILVFGIEEAGLIRLMAEKLLAATGGDVKVTALANLVVAGFAERAGTPIRFVLYLKTAFPLMLLSIAISHVYVYFRYF
jgi:Na+/H+ antiporter NhaD/arsenite permease-like protein